MIDPGEIAAAAMAARARITGEAPPQNKKKKNSRVDMGTGKRVQLTKSSAKDIQPSQKKYGGALPEMKSMGEELRPDLSNISEVAAFAARKRKTRLLTPNSALKVTDKCPFPCCHGVEPVHFLVVNGKVVPKTGIHAGPGPHTNKLRSSRSRPGTRGRAPPGPADMAMQAQAAMQARQARQARAAPKVSPPQQPALVPGIATATETVPASAPAPLSAEDEERRKLEEEIRQIEIMLAEKLKLEAEIKAIQDAIAAAAQK